MDRNLYATTSSNAPGGRVFFFKIDPVTYSMQQLELTGITLMSPDYIDSLEYDSQRNVFWGTISNRSELIRIDAATRVISVVGQFPEPAGIGGIALDRRNDILYGVRDLTPGANPSSTLVVINPDETTFTTIGEPGLGLGLYDLDSLAFNPKDGMLYAIHDGNTGTSHWGQLVRIDPATGAALLIGASSFSNVEIYQGIAFVIPEPSGMASFMTVFLAMSSHRQQRRRLTI
jgi:hypothetical protein